MSVKVKGEYEWAGVTLMTGTLGLNRDDSWFRTSARSCWCFRTFLIFMILTIAAYKHTWLVKRWSTSGLTTTWGEGVNVHLDQQLSIFLYVLVSRLLLLFLLRLHRDIDVHSQLLTAEKRKKKINHVTVNIHESFLRWAKWKVDSHFLYPRKSLMTVSGLNSTSSTLAFSSSNTWRTHRVSGLTADLKVTIM